MEFAYETAPGYWRKANTAIRDCLSSATEPKATSASPPRTRAYTSCTVENRPTVTAVSSGFQSFIYCNEVLHTDGHPEWERPLFRMR